MGLHDLAMSKGHGHYHHRLLRSAYPLVAVSKHVHRVLRLLSQYASAERDEAVLVWQELQSNKGFECCMHESIW